MRALIYGAGAMGTVLGAFISRAGVQIDLVTRNRAHVSALNERGAHVSGTVDFRVKVNAYLPEEMTGVYDVIFLMTKQRGNRETAEFLKNYLAEGGVICTTQNGLPEPLIAQIVGKENCVGCAISWGATFIGAGEAALTSSPDKLTFAVGSPFGDNPKIQKVAPYLRLMGEVSEESNFIGARWSKLIVNSAFSTLSALSGLTFGEVAKNFRSRRLAQAILKEGMDAAAAAGVTCAKIQGHDLVRLLGYKGKFKKAVSFALIPLAMKKHKRLVSGMYYDLINGKKCDVDFVCGTVVEYGERYGAHTPVARAAVELIHAIERGEKSISPENFVELEKSVSLGLH